MKKSKTILDTLRHTNKLPARCREIENALSAINQNMAIAADEIERLTAENKQLKKKLAKISK